MFPPHRPARAQAIDPPIPPAAPRVRYPGPALWRPDCRDADLREGGRELVQLAVEITAPPEDTGDGRRALGGKILQAGHPVFDRYVGQNAQVMGPRNPVTYFESPLDGQGRCACGCARTAAARTAAARAGRHGRGLLRRDHQPGT